MESLIVKQALGTIARDEAGSTAGEYALVAALIVAAIVSSAAALGQEFGGFSAWVAMALRNFAH